MLSDMGKIMVFVGAVLVVLGVVIWLAGKAPESAKFWIGRLPGDIRIERDHFKFYFPLTTCILISIILTLIFWLVSRFRQ